MNLHRIADLTVDMGYKYDRLKYQAMPYRITENEEPIVTIYLSDEFLERRHTENPAMTPEIAEYVYTGSIFNAGLVKYNGIMLHSSAVVMDGTAYLFTADSGTGKSTHTALWQEVFGKDRAKILNDDKPAIRILKDGIFAYGTPWSGKTDLNINMKARLGGICILERGEKNEIHRENGGAVVTEIMRQSVRTTDRSDTEMFLQNVDFILRNIPVYRMKCNISTEAAEMAYGVMSKF